MKRDMRQLQVVAMRCDPQRGRADRPRERVAHRTVNDGPATSGWRGGRRDPELIGHLPERRTRSGQPRTASRRPDDGEPLVAGGETAHLQSLADRILRRKGARRPRRDRRAALVVRRLERRGREAQHIGRVNRFGGPLPDSVRVLGHLFRGLPFDVDRGTSQPVARERQIDRRHGVYAGRGHAFEDRVQATPAFQIRVASRGRSSSARPAIVGESMSAVWAAPAADQRTSGGDLVTASATCAITRARRPPCLTGLMAPRPPAPDRRPDRGSTPRAPAPTGQSGGQERDAGRERDHRPSTNPGERGRPWARAS